MIHRVEIDNFALVEHAELDLGSGLTVLSGETGAGKSIVIDALDFATGARSDRSMLRTGAFEASVSILLDPSAAETENGEFVVLRTLRDTNRSYAKINGQLVTAGELRDKMEPLLAIHSQNDQQTIFRESVHKTLLDAFSKDTIRPLQEEWEALRLEMTEIGHRLGELFTDPTTRQRRRDILLYQSEEIEGANLQSGEDESLLKRIKTLSAVREISIHLGKAEERLSGDESVTSLLNQVITELSSAGRYSATIESLNERAIALKTELSELGYDLSRVAERLEDEPEALEDANERYKLIRRLEEKYGPTLDEVILYGEKAKKELLRLDQTEEELQTLTDLQQTHYKTFQQMSKSLFDVRRKAADSLEQAINRELFDLDMKHASFTVAIEKRAFSADEIPTDPQHVRFMIAPNPGEPELPLVSIISGGEASRVLLAVKTVLAGLDQVSTIIFDEIDTGISGQTTTRIAEKLRSIARHAQVICVTHSAQIAAYADCQLLIGKHVEAGRTRTSITEITGEARIDEIARLLSGRPDDPKSRTLAASMLEQAKTIP
ncbi:MAG: DNA repair protein RecN [Clostridiales bacterium]|nr:DNA repair protein RecN [Clostridiales bacterium]